MTKTKQMRTLYACLTLILITGSIFIALAFGAGRRAKPSDTQTSEQSESITSSDPKGTENNETGDPTETEKSPESTKPTVEVTPEENAPVSVQIEDINFVSPADGNVIVTCSLTVPVYSMTMNDYRTHMGIDVAASEGSPVMSCADGTVSSVYEDPMMGTTVEVTHGEGIISVYNNLCAELPEGVTTGAKLSAGDTLGYVGNTALIECEEESHLHFELHLDGKEVDPTEYIQMTLASETYED
ncbi:MAG: M23 family metallopeptidase [Clostridia bacterium]|nr:M23 family metallopeptidase [Clostridia bacterium]